MSRERPCNWNTSWTRSSTVFLADGSLGKATKGVILKNRFTAVRMVVFVLMEVIQSWNWGINGMRDRQGHTGEVFKMSWAQTDQVETYSQTALEAVGHRRHCRTNAWMTGELGLTEPYSRMKSKVLKKRVYQAWAFKQSHLNISGQ